MKKILVSFLIMSSVALASYGLVVNGKEADDLKDRFKLYTQGIQGGNLTLKNHIAKREIIIGKRMDKLPKTSKVVFGDLKDGYNGAWEINRNKDGIQYFSVPGTARRKASKKIDGRYVVLFYRAIGKNDEMVEDTFKDITKSLTRY